MLSEIRKRIILSFEEAEYEDDPEIRQAKLTFMIIGGGPTGSKWQVRSKKSQPSRSQRVSKHRYDFGSSNSRRRC